MKKRRFHPGCLMLFSTGILNFRQRFHGSSLVTWRPRKYIHSKRDVLYFYFTGNHSAARLIITLSRELRSHLLESYLPSTLFVIISWGSFIIMPEVVPGRMVLLVTTLLTLITMFDTVRSVFFFSIERRPFYFFDIDLNYSFAETTRRTL